MEGEASTTVKKPPWVAAWVASVLTISVLVLGFLLERGEVGLLRKAALLPAIIAGILAVIPMFTLRKHGETEPGKSYMHTSVVVDRGFFAVVRHPQYLGYILIDVAFMLILQSWPVFVLGILAIGFFYLHAIREEQFCIQKFGQDYLDYVKRVPRFNFLLGLVRWFRASKSSSQAE